MYSYKHFLHSVKSKINGVTLRGENMTRPEWNTIALHLSFSYKDTILPMAKSAK